MDKNLENEQNKKKKIDEITTQSGKLNLFDVAPSSERSQFDDGTSLNQHKTREKR